LMWATAVNRIHCVRALLECKANPILTDVQGETAMSAVRSKPVADLLTKAMKSSEFSELGDDAMEWTRMTSLSAALKYICATCGNASLAEPMATEISRTTCAKV